QVITKQIDLTYLYQRTKSNPTLMLEMIQAYLEQTPPLIYSMKQSLVDKDWNTLHASVHKMIPSFSIMGMNKQFEIMAKQVQEFASNMEHNESIHELVMKLEEACTKACMELQDEIINIKNTKSE
ncbi:MAG: hybrid sensor histidine kinase/response regulator, partial [Saprospiraceae bacterium]